MTPDISMFMISKLEPQRPRTGTNHCENLLLCNRSPQTFDKSGFNEKQMGSEHKRFVYSAIQFNP